MILYINSILFLINHLFNQIKIRNQINRYCFPEDRPLQSNIHWQVDFLLQRCYEMIEYN